MGRNMLEIHSYTCRNKTEKRKQTKTKKKTVKQKHFKNILSVHILGEPVENTLIFNTPSFE